ncbi:hypothetical protein A5781_06130 [Mycobacterium sp. 852002-30065_SCH5024008]|nr:hypothetical protein A5781_06130 [Mycobacterium sp. 852002-30065_SCH5024008]
MLYGVEQALIVYLTESERAGGNATFRAFHTDIRLFSNTCHISRIVTSDFLGEHLIGDKALFGAVKLILFRLPFFGLVAILLVCVIG